MIHPDRTRHTAWIDCGEWHEGTIDVEIIFLHETEDEPLLILKAWYLGHDIVDEINHYEIEKIIKSGDY